MIIVMRVGAKEHVSSVQLFNVSFVHFFFRHSGKEVRKEIEPFVASPL